MVKIVKHVSKRLKVHQAMLNGHIYGLVGGVIERVIDNSPGLRDIVLYLRQSWPSHPECLKEGGSNRDQFRPGTTNRAAACRLVATPSRQIWM